MKILFKTIQRPKNELRQDEQADYQSDLLFHGLRSLLGSDCVDVPKKDYMYESYDSEKAKGLWGRGFTYSRTLSDIDVDRNLSAEDADFVVFSVHHSVQFNYDYQIAEFLRLGNIGYRKVAVVDGHDWPQFNRKLASFTPFFFKRELVPDEYIEQKAIWFAIPTTKVVKEIPNKVRDFARIYPGSNERHWPQNSRASHTFTDEESYYREYQESKFAFTCKKGGWDCMRHLEIMANGCIPIFTDIEDCPSHTCEGLPKQMLIAIKRTAGLSLPNINPSNRLCYPGFKALFGEEKWEGTNEDYYGFLHHCLSWVKERGHTEYLAKYFLKECKLW